MAKRIRWSIDSIYAESSKFETVKEFSKNPAYQAAARYGILKDVCKNMKKGITYSDDFLINEAKKYKSISEFRKENDSFYTLIRNRSIQDKAYSHMERCGKNYKEDFARKRVFEAALNFKSRKEFNVKDSKNYGYALSKGWLDEACSHMEYLYRNQTNDEIFKIAKKYSTRIDFYRSDRKSLETARYRGIEYQVCAHMVKAKTSSENNVIYIWRAKELIFNSLPVYKIGITSTRVGKKRIKDVSLRAKLSPEIITISKVKIKASTLEKQIHKIGFNPKYSGFDGCTEFRAMNDDQLKQAVNLINQYAA